MHAPTAHWGLRARTQGFSLIELMIAVAVVGILLAVALPSYQSSVRKGRRAEAINAINAVQQAQERWRANHANYASNLDATPDADTLPNVSATTPNSYYALAIDRSSTSPGTTYTVTATATGPQAADTVCATLGARVAGGTLSYGSGSTSVDWTATNPDANRCWAK
jgi:type IV pilus assembly protein PilE